MINIRGVIFYLGVYSFVISFFLIINYLYSLYFQFNLGFESYLISFAISSFLGIFFFLFGKNNKLNISYFDQLFLVIIGFFYLPLIMSFPIYFSNYNLSFLNSYFETVSGFTSTGFTIIQNINTIDESLILWRSTIQWLGGIYFFISLISILGTTRAKIKATYLVSNEFFGGNFYNNFFVNSFKIFSIYFAGTILIFSLYMISEIRFFNGFNLAMTVISSGGFLSENSLSKIIRNDFQFFILTLTIFIPLFNFFFFYKIIFRKFRYLDYFEDFYNFFFVCFIVFILFFFIKNEANILSLFFIVLSSLTNIGINIDSSNLDLSFLFLLLTIVGGSSASVTSGFKTSRIYLLLKFSVNEMAKLVKPMNVFNQNMFNKTSKFNDQDVKNAFLVFLFFILMLFLLTSFLSFENLNIEKSFKLAILTLTNTVNSNIYDLSNINFSLISIFGKMSLIFFMIVGKVEFIAFLLIIKRIFNRD